MKAILQPFVGPMPEFYPASSLGLLTGGYRFSDGLRDLYQSDNLDAPDALPFGGSMVRRILGCDYELVLSCSRMFW